MPDFSTAQVGDRVWSDRCGYGKITNIANDSYITVYFDSELEKYKVPAPITFYLDGRREQSDAYPELHWDKPQFVEPPPPNRYVCEHG